MSAEQELPMPKEKQPEIPEAQKLETVDDDWLRKYFEDSVFFTIHRHMAEGITEEQTEAMIHDAFMRAQQRIGNPRLSEAVNRKITEPQPVHVVEVSREPQAVQLSSNVVSETRFARVERRRVSSPEGMTAEEIRADNVEYYERLQKVIGKEEAVKAFDEYIAWVSQEGDQAILVTRLQSSENPPSKQDLPEPPK